MGASVNLVGQKFNHLLVIEKTELRSGTSILWRCQCDCGVTTLATSYELKSGHKKSCGCLQIEYAKKLGTSKGKNLVGQIFGNLTVIEKTNKRQDGRIVWKCRCSCGQIIEVPSAYLLRGTKTHCGCQATNSKGEKKVVELLEQYGLAYKREKSFPDLLSNNKRLRFDFFVENLFLIEYDGKQHFIKDSGYGADLENIQQRDKLKNAYALQKHIPLVRINYQDYDNFTIYDIVPEQFQFLLKEGRE